MKKKDYLNKVESELQEGMKLIKCRKCGCMRDILEFFGSNLSTSNNPEFSDLKKNAESWLKELEPVEYSCIGCEHCFPAVATNIINQAFPETLESQSLSCAFEVKKELWPPVSGEYFISNEKSCSVAVSTLGSTELPGMIAYKKPMGLCIVGKTETENIGIDKIIKNTITNPAIKFLILAGVDSKGHLSGSTILNLIKNGVDENMKVIGSLGQRPILKNVNSKEIEAFRKQIQIIDMINCEDVDEIASKINELTKQQMQSCSCAECNEVTEPFQVSTAPIVHAKETKKVELDKSGYFVIIPDIEKKIITVEHYANDDRMLRVIAGKDAVSIYKTIIENGWVSQLSHSAYLGRELTKAELSIKYKFRYLQDGM